MPHKDISKSQDDEFARSVRVRDAARRAFIAVDTDQRLPRAAVSASRPDRLTFEPGSMCYFWRDGVGWSPGMATVVSQVGQVTIMLTMVDECSNNLLSNCHMSRNVNAWPEAVRESQDPGRKVDHLSDEETELPQQPSQTSGQENNVAPVSPSDVPMPDPVPAETPDENAETSNDDRENTAELVPHSSSSHWEWRPEYEVPPPETGDSAVTRRRVVAKRPPTGDEEEGMRRKRLRSEPVPELFPLTGEELSEIVFEILIDLFASLGSEHCEDSRVSAGSEQCEGSRVPEAHVYIQDRDRFRPLKRRVEVLMRDFSRARRLQSSTTKGVDFVVGQGSCGTGQLSDEPSREVEECLNRESPESSIALT